MNTIGISKRVLDPIVFVLLIVTAMVTPWWGTPVAVFALRVLFQISVRRLAALTFASWFVACFARDALGGWGPARVLARMLFFNTMDAMGLSVSSPLARAGVYAIVSLLGCVLALFSAGLVKAVQDIVSNPAADTSRG